MLFPGRLPRGAKPGATRPTGGIGIVFAARRLLCHSLTRSLASLLPPTRGRRSGSTFFGFAESRSALSAYAAEGGCARRHEMSARPFWYRSRATASSQRFFAFGETALPSLPALRSTYPTGVGGSPSAPWPLGQPGCIQSVKIYPSQHNYLIHVYAQSVEAC